MDGGAWCAAVHGSRIRLSNFTFTFHFHALKKEMATHSSVLAWRIPGMGEPGGLPSVGLHRVGHNWCDLAAAATAAVHICQSQSLSSSHPPHLVIMFVLYICDSISDLQANKFICIIFLDSTHKQYYVIFAFLFLTSLCMTVSRPIRISAIGTISFLLLAEWYSIVYMYQIYLSRHKSQSKVRCSGNISFSRIHLDLYFICLR